MSKPETADEWLDITGIIPNAQAAETMRNVFKTNAGAWFGHAPRTCLFMGGRCVGVTKPPGPNAGFECDAGVTRIYGRRCFLRVAVKRDGRTFDRWWTHNKMQLYDEADFGAMLQGLAVAVQADCPLPTMALAVNTPDEEHDE